MIEAEECVFVYMTTKDADEAKRIGEDLVSGRLAACANILDGMQSLYWWEGAVQKGAEAVLIAKTRRARVDELVSRIRALHSYECPCIVVLPIVGGNADFLAWIRQETVKPA